MRASNGFQVLGDLASSKASQLANGIKGELGIQPNDGYSYIRYSRDPSFANWINKWVIFKTYDESGHCTFLWIYQYNKTAKAFLSSYKESFQCDHIGWLWSNGNQFAVLETKLGAQELYKAADENGWDTKEFMSRDRGIYSKAMRSFEEGCNYMHQLDADGWNCDRTSY